MPVCRLGDRGPEVAEVRARLERLGLVRPGGPPDAFDAELQASVRAFQQQRGLTADGVVAGHTWRVLEDARWRLGDRVLSYSVSRPLQGDDVEDLQQRLLEMGFHVGRLDSVLGPTCEAAVREFQRGCGLPGDGVVGPATLQALRRLDRSVRGGRPHLLREGEAVRRAGSALVGKTVVLDPGHGGDDRGAHAAGLAEADVVEDLATRLEGRLLALGVRALLTRGRHQNPDDEQRAAFANAAGADLLLSFHVDSDESPRAGGVATYHFGTRAGTSSTIGERLASLVQREVVARTGLRDGRTHAKSWPLLRRSVMPAVRLELGYLSNPDDRGRLADPQVRAAVADGVLAAVQRLYLPETQDAPTGQLRVVSGGDRRTRSRT